MTIVYLIALAVLCGIFGRLGGAAKSGQWYDFLCNTKTRDAGCSLCILAAWMLLYKFNPSFWWVYLITFGLQWAAFTTYFDKWFKFDNLGFSGFVVGLVALPLIIVQHDAWIMLVVRAFVLGTIWFMLNKHLPSKVLIWRHDVAEEFLRYKAVII